MKAVVAIDSFKGCLDSMAAGDAVKEGILRADSANSVAVFSVADGGEGTCAALMQGLDGRLRSIAVSDPLGRKIEIEYGISADNTTAVIEMAAAAGLPLLQASERNPMKTTTFGVGEIISDALNQGCRRFLIGLGGSATNDGGVGMLQALGFEFLSADGTRVEKGAIGLKNMNCIDLSNADKRLKECDFRVAVDVDNPLCGKEGCSAVFAPQKGANSDDIRLMDAWLRNYADLTKARIGKDFSALSGVGAAGGMGFACAAYLGAHLEPGIEIVLSEIGIESAIAECDVVVTGEGRLDGQSVHGKTPVGIAKLAKKYGKTVIALTGTVGSGANACNQFGIDAYFPILDMPMELSEAMRPEVAMRNLARTAEQCFRLLGKMRTK